MDLLHAMSTGLISDAGMEEKTVEGGVLNVYNARVGLLSVMSVRFDIDMQKRSGVAKGGDMTVATFFHMMKTKMLSFSKTVNDQVIQTPAVALTDDQGNSLAPAGGVRFDPEGHHVDYSKEITVNGSGAIDVADQEIVPAVQSDKRIGVHKIYISTTSTAGTISIDFAGSTSQNVDKFYCANGSREEIQRHALSALAESMKITGSGLTVGSKIFYAIQVVPE